MAQQIKQATLLVVVRFQLRPGAMTWVKSWLDSLPCLSLLRNPVRPASCHSWCRGAAPAAAQLHRWKSAITPAFTSSSNTAGSNTSGVGTDVSFPEPHENTLF
jgi:hypothetical protein